MEKRWDFTPKMTPLPFNKRGRTSANVAVVGAVFFGIMVISNAAFAYLQFATHSYIIINGILLLLFLLIEYLIAKAKQ